MQKARQDTKTNAGPSVRPNGWLVLSFARRNLIQMYMGEALNERGILQKGRRGRHQSSAWAR
jgi:hypothetical protein